jgi:hypothetical protein
MKSTSSSSPYLSLAFWFLFLVTDRAQVHGMPDILGTASASSPSSTSSPLPKGDNPSNNHNFLHDLLHGSATKTEMLEEMVSHSTLAGSLKPAIRKLLLSKEEGAHLIQTISKMVHWEDLILILIAGWLVVPSIEIPYNWLGLPVNIAPFRKTYTFAVADHLQQVAKIALDRALNSANFPNFPTSLPRQPILSGSPIVSVTLRNTCSGNMSIVIPTPLDESKLSIDSSTP